MTEFVHEFDWQGTAADPNDRQFGDVVEPVTMETTGDVDAVIVGEPYDGAVIGRSGASDGPAAIRRALASLTTHHFDCGPVSGVGDLGDVAVPDDRSVSGVQREIRSVVDRVHSLDALPLFVGGDNSLTVANVSPLLDRGSVGVINFDAHLDVRAVQDEPTSGTPYRQLLEAGLDGYVVVGARHFETSTAYHEYLTDTDGATVTAEEVGEDTIAAIDAAVSMLGAVDHLYVSVDCDVLDASAAPGVSAPTPGGLTTRELFRLLRLVAADERLAGAEIVECAPELDREGRTVDAAARAIAHLLASYGVSR